MSALQEKFSYFLSILIDVAVNTDGWSCLWCLCEHVGPEEDDIQVTNENYHQHAEPLPLPVCQSPIGMDSFPLQYALLYRFHGTGIPLCLHVCLNQRVFNNHCIKKPNSRMNLIILHWQFKSIFVAAHHYFITFRMLGSF